MYIVAIGWLYVVLLMAMTEANIVAGAATLLFYGLIPVAILWWLVGAKTRRRQRLLSEQRPGDSDGGDAKPDQ